MDALMSWNMLFPIGWHTLWFNARMRNAREIADGQNVSQFGITAWEDPVNPDQRKQSADEMKEDEREPRDIPIPKLNDTDDLYETMLLFGPRCHMGLNTLNTTVLTVGGLAPRAYEPVLNRALLCLDLSAMLGRQLDVEQLIIHTSKLSAIGTARFLLGPTLILCIKGRINDAELAKLQAAADAKNRMGAVDRLTFKRAHGRAWFDRHNKVRTSF